MLLGWGCAACSLLTDTSGLSGGGSALDGGDATTGDGSADAAVVTYRAAVLADKPISYLRFGEKSGVLASDETGSGNTGDVNGAVVWGVPGALGSDKDTAVRLDGKTSLIDLGGKIDFAGTAPFSLEIWFNAVTVDTSYRFLVAKDQGVGPAREEWGIVIQKDNGFYFERFVANVQRSAATAAPGVGRWVYTVATYDGTHLELFVDGALVVQTADARPQLSKIVPLYIGGGPAGAGFDGTIDELAIYDRALPAERIKAHFDAAK